MARRARAAGRTRRAQPTKRPAGSQLASSNVDIQAAGSRWAAPSHILEPLGALARWWLKFLSAKLFADSVITAILVWMAVGGRPPAVLSPVFDLIHDHPFRTLAAGAALLSFTVASMVLRRRVEDPKPGTPSSTVGSPLGPWTVPALAATSGLSTLSTLTVVVMVALLVSRPAWCPQALCLQPPGPHDSFLEANLTAVQSPSYQIPDEPGRYTLSSLPPAAGPRAIAAVSAGMAKDSSGYYPLRFVLRVHSLQTGRLAMFIEQIALRVTSAKPPARPLRVWLRGSPLEYRTNPHTAVYRGQRQGETIAAVYAGTTVPQGHVQLAPGESDELTVELASQEVVDLTFRLEVLYTNAEDATVRRLALPYDLRTIFSDSLNWQPYRLVDGRLVQA